jgi:hypothetical protein
MSDDLTKKIPQDSSKVNVNEAWEVKYWCEKFGCTEARLKEAVRAVGVSAKAVEAYLKNR